MNTIQKIRISDKEIGGGRCFVIAEAGSNHNGNFEMAKKLIDVAAESGADAVKFQTFKASKMYTTQAGESDYLKVKKSIYNIIKEMEMPYEWIPLLAEYCKEKKIMFLSTPFDEESADILDPYLEAFKIASYESTHIPLLRHIAKKGKPIILSTGATTMEEIKEAVKTIREEGNNNICLLQCTASYPAKLESININAMESIRENFGDIPVGLSDHSRDHIIVPVAAVAKGAAVFEKHFSLSNNLPGPDQAFAVEPNELKCMIKSIRNTENALGVKEKKVGETEQELYDFAKRSVFAVREIKKGQQFNHDNIAVLRHGKSIPGLHPREFNSLIGKKAAKEIPAQTGIKKEDVE